MNIAVAELRGPGRRRDLSDVRAMAGYVGKRLGGITWNRMARYLHRDGSTLVRDVGRLEQRLAKDAHRPPTRNGHCSRAAASPKIIHEFRTDPHPHPIAPDTWNYLYDGSDERIAKIPPFQRSWAFTLRDESARVASEFSGATRSRDNVFLGNQLVASYANGAVEGNGPVWVFYASDHLGTPRLLTNIAGTSGAGVEPEPRRYWPFGEAVTTQTGFQALCFATMEFDAEGGTGPGLASDRYYDHARSYVGGLGRFLSPDKVGGSPEEPQSWNRFSYTRGNPLTRIDPDGRIDRSTMEIHRRGGAWANVGPSPPAGLGTAIATLAVMAPLVVALAPAGTVAAAFVNLLLSTGIGAVGTPREPGAGAAVGALIGTFTGPWGGPGAMPIKAMGASVVSDQMLDGKINWENAIGSAIAGAAAGAQASAAAAAFEAGAARAVGARAMTEILIEQFNAGLAEAALASSRGTESDRRRRLHPPPKTCNSTGCAP